MKQKQKQKQKRCTARYPISDTESVQCLLPDNHTDQFHTAMNGTIQWPAVRPRRPKPFTHVVEPASPAPAPVLSWEPRRYPHPQFKHVECFCSAACGAHCTYEAYLSARTKAVTIAAECGPSFIADLTENLGWYGGAVSACGHLRVRRSMAHNAFARRDQEYIYSCYIGKRNDSAIEFTGESYTAQEAIQNAVQEARNRIADIRRWIAEYDEVPDEVPDERNFPHDN